MHDVGRIVFWSCALSRVPRSQQVRKESRFAMVLIGFALEGSQQGYQQRAWLKLVRILSKKLNFSGRGRVALLFAIEIPRCVLFQTRVCQRMSILSHITTMFDGSRCPNLFKGGRSHYEEHDLCRQIKNKETSDRLSPENMAQQKTRPGTIGRYVLPLSFSTD